MTYCRGQPAVLARTIVEHSGNGGKFAPGADDSLLRARRAERERDLLVAVSDAARGAVSMELAMEKALEAVCTATGWDYAEAWLADGPHWRRLPLWYGSRDRFEAFHLGLEEQPDGALPPLVGQTVASGYATWIRDISTVSTAEFSRTSLALQYGLHATLALPLTGHGRVLAVLVFMLAAPRERDEATVEIMEFVGAQLGATLGELKARLDLERSEERFRLIAENVGDAFWLTDGTFSRNFYISPAAERVWGLSLEQMYRDPDQSYWGPMLSEDRERIARIIERVRDENLDYEYRIRRPDGEVRWLREHTRRIRDEDGVVTRIAGVTSDITDIHRQEEELHRWAERFELAAGAAGIGIWEYRFGEDAMTWDARMYDLYGVDPATFTADYASWKALLHPEDRDSYERQVLDDVAGNSPFDTEFRIVRPDGQVRHIRSRGIVVRDTGGEPVRITGVNLDITTQRETERRLANAQRMESIAQLSAGVAHDFNNILGTVKASLQLVARHRALATDARALERITRAVDAIDRGASLAQRLLAYSRRQRLVSEKIDVAALLTGMAALLRRTVGSGIVVELDLAPELPAVKTDASQLENAMVNLALNAREAMPHGGRLAIRVDRATVGAGDNRGRAASAPDGQSWVADGKSIPAGEYLRITVTDSGHGMTPEVRARAFEPFFTTRQAGEATGLGLSSILGFVRQSGGNVTLDSAPDAGTSVGLYFPAAGRPPESGRVESADRRETSTGTGGEHILVVDDDDDLREVTAEALESLGYRVEAAACAADALDILERHPGIALLFTDIVIPGGMDGIQLAEAARARRADLKVLFVSGYAEDAIRRSGVCPERFRWIQKPVDMDDMANIVRQTLDAPA